MSGSLQSLTGAVLLLTAGCMPSPEARSAGQIGCSPHEISISGEQFHPVLIQSGETWVAECRGRTFYCTQIDGRPRKRQLFNLASDQIRCREDVDSAERQIGQGRVEARPRAAEPTVAAPIGAAGFDFGLLRAEAQQRCESAERQWSQMPDGNNCSGPAAELGIAAKVHLAFCDDRVCAITIEHHPSSHWAARTVQLKTQLEAKYGEPQSGSGSIPEDCRSNEAFARCLRVAALHLSYKWQWPSGEAIELDVGQPAPRAEDAIRLLYSRPSGSANPLAL